MEEEEERDLSSWRVRIFNVDNKLDPSTGKQTPTYTIFVQRIRPADGNSSIFFKNLVFFFNRYYYTF